MVSKEGGQRAEWIDRGGSGGSGGDGGLGLGIGSGSGSGSGSGGGRCWIYWRRPEEWAAVIENWVDETGQKGSVLTLYEIAEGDGAVGQGMSSFLSLCALSIYLFLCTLFPRTKTGDISMYASS
jgi:ESCRT-II complex subunit VPS25